MHWTQHITYLSVRIIFHGLGFYLLKELTSFLPNRIVVFSYIAEYLISAHGRQTTTSIHSTAYDRRKE